MRGCWCAGGLADHGGVRSAEDRGIRAVPLLPLRAVVSDEATLTEQQRSSFSEERAAGTDVTHFAAVERCRTGGGSVHFVEAFSRNGMRFTVLDEGPADAETVVLLHGFG